MSTRWQSSLFDGDQEVLDRLRNPVLTARVGKNGPLFADICRLYVPDGSRVLDMTYGLGGFWTIQGLAERYKLVSMDNERNGVMVKASLEHLPFHAETFDAVVLDPPYANQGGHNLNTNIGVVAQYNLQPTTSSDVVIDYYAAGAEQACQILRPGGLLIMKCQDAIESGRQHWTHVDVLRQTEAIGFMAEDLFILVQDGTPIMRHNYQHHARKNHSFFWCFRKCK